MIRSARLAFAAALGVGLLANGAVATAQSVKEPTLCEGEARATCINGAWEQLGYRSEQMCKNEVEAECESFNNDQPWPVNVCYFGKICFW